jgi:hypothetical protein
LPQLLNSSPTPYPNLHKDHIRKEAKKAFADRAEDPDIKIQLLLGGEKTVSEAL